MEEFTKLYDIQDVAKELHKASDIFGIEGGKDNLTTTVVIYGHVTEVPAESFVSSKMHKAKSCPHTPLPDLICHMALVTNLP